MDGRWREETEAILTGFKEWRLQHPRATLSEIEAALDARWAVARARLVADAALASAAADLRAVPPEQRPRCPDCGAALEARGQEVRHLTTTHEQPLTLTRHRAVCPACGLGLFPPG
jgi:hypothetical protein